VGLDARPEARLVQATLVIDEEAIASAFGRHDDAVHMITMAEIRLDPSRLQGRLRENGAGNSG
jgi:hypothetical protein